MAEQIYLSRRNLLMLLSKLDRKAAGESTACTIIKFQNKTDPFVQSMDAISVTAVENSEFYAGRNPGAMHPNDEVAVAEKAYGDMMATMEDEIAPEEFQNVTLDFELIPIPTKTVYTGYENGVAAREVFKLDELDDYDVRITFNIPENTYSISDSFWRGLLDDSLNKFGDKQSARQKFFATGSSVFETSMYSYISRHFFMRTK